MNCPYSWWLQPLWLCQEHVLQWGTLARLCFAKKFISSFYSLTHHSSFYEQGGDPQEDEMGISGGSPDEQCLQINKSPWSSEVCFTDTRVHTHVLTGPPSIEGFLCSPSFLRECSVSVSTQAFYPLHHEKFFSLKLREPHEQWLLPLFSFSGFFTVHNQRQERTVMKWISKKGNIHHSSTQLLLSLQNNTKPVSMLILNVLV